MNLLPEAISDSDSHPLFNDVDVIVVYDQVTAQILDHPSIFCDDLGLVRLDRHRLHSLQFVFRRWPPICPMRTCRLGSRMHLDFCPKRFHEFFEIEYLIFFNVLDILARW